MTAEAHELHRIISASVRDMLSAYRIQAQVGRVSEQVLEGIVFRAAHPIVNMLAPYPADQRAALLPNVVPITCSRPFSRRSHGREKLHDRRHLHRDLHTAGRFMSSDGGLLLALAAIVIIAIITAKVAYKEGYQRGQADLLQPSPLTEDQRNTILMKAVLPLWRRLGGWAALLFSGLSFWGLMFLVIRYGNGSGWLFLLATILSLAILIGALALSEWLWKPFREAQARLRKANLEKKDAG